MEEKELLKDEKKNKVDVKKILVIIGNVIFYAVIIMLFLFSLMNINAGNGKENFPNLFGKGMLNVETKSMERNKGGYHRPEWDSYTIQEINAGDLVYVNVFSGNLDDIKVGDVVTFYDPAIEALNTHRVVEVAKDSIVCQGDYVATLSQSDTYAYDLTGTNISKNSGLVDSGDAQLVTLPNIKGVVTGVSSGAGSVLSNIRQNWLFYFVIPVAVVLLIEIVFVVKNFLDLRHEKNKAALADDKEAMLAELEAEKEKMRQELLAELRAQQAAAQAPAEEAQEVEEPEETSVEDEAEEEKEENNEVEE